MNPPRLLIFDDDAALRRMLAFSAEACGAEACETGDAEEFFRLLAQWRPSHLALDLLMPALSGEQLLARLGQLGCGARVIIISGQGGAALDQARRLAERQGLDVAAALAKPFSLAALRAALRPTGAAES